MTNNSRFLLNFIQLRISPMSLDWRRWYQIPNYCGGRVPSPFLPMSDLCIWGITPPPAMVALMSVSSSSSPLIASCRCLGVILFTLRSLDAFPASSRTSAVRYSNIAELYTAAVAPTLPEEVARDFRCRWILPTGNWSPALADLLTAFCLVFPESFPALPPAILRVLDV